MRQIITAAVLTVAMATGVQGKPPSGGQGNNGNQGTIKKLDGIKLDTKKLDIKPLDTKKLDIKPLDTKKLDTKKLDFKKIDPKFNQVGSGKYLAQHGKKFSQGVYYCGKNHCHWSYCCFWPKYGCDCYYCPDACVWYYYCQPRQCYLPVTCIEVAPPVVVAEATATAVNNVTVNVNSTPTDLPPVLPTGPDGSGPVQAFKAPPMK